MQVAKVTHFKATLQVEPAEEEQVKVDYRDAKEDVCSLRASAILIATGRKPMTEELNLEGARIRTNSKGFIDELMRATVPDIWASVMTVAASVYLYLSG